MWIFLSNEFGNINQRKVEIQRLWLVLRSTDFGRRSRNFQEAAPESVRLIGKQVPLRKRGRVRKTGQLLRATPHWGEYLLSNSAKPRMIPFDQVTSLPRVAPSLRAKKRRAGQLYKLTTPIYQNTRRGKVTVSIITPETTPNHIRITTQIIPHVNPSPGAITEHPTTKIWQATVTLTHREELLSQPLGSGSSAVSPAQDSQPISNRLTAPLLKYIWHLCARTQFLVPYRFFFAPVPAQCLLLQNRL